MEELLHRHGVDMAIWAHEHIYERLWPTYNSTVYNGTDAPYKDPPAPVHITTGSAGCRERHTIFNKTVPAWIAQRSNEYGYTRLNVHNSSHAHIEQVSADRPFEVIDDFWIVKSKHGSYANP